MTDNPCHGDTPPYPDPCHHDTRPKCTDNFLTSFGSCACTASLARANRTTSDRGGCFTALADVWASSRGRPITESRERRRIGAALRELLTEHPTTTPDDIHRQARRIADETADYPEPPELHPFALLAFWLDEETR